MPSRSSIGLACALALAAVACTEHHAVPAPDGSADADVDSGDGPIDCSTIGCGAAPICGEPCDSPCGCCPCGGGFERDGVTYVCDVGAGCYVADEVPADPCAASSECPDGFACCYPCGIPGCELSCTPACDPAEPGCIDGCFAYP